MATRTGRLARWWLDRPLRSKGLAVLAPPAMVLVITVAASFIAERYQVALGDSTSNATATASQAGNVLALLLGAESSVGEYARTGDVSSLKWYRQAESQLPEPLGVLAKSTASGSDLSVLAQAELGKLALTVGAVASHGPPAAIEADLTDAVTPMDTLRGDLNALQASELGTVASNHSEVDTIQTAAQGVEIAGLLIGVVGGMTAMVLFVRFVVRRIGEVGANAQRLGVSEPLAPVTSAADEIGELADELRATSTLLTQRSTDLVRAHTAAVEAADQADQLLSRVSHELRTPLTAVLGFGHLIDRSRLSEEDSEAVEQILHGGGHMLRILEEGRIPSYTSRSIELDLVPVEVAPLVREVLTLLSPLSNGRHLDVAGCDDAREAVLADYHRFKQVLINLLSNAVKYNQVGGQCPGDLPASCGWAGAGCGHRHRRGDRGRSDRPSVRAIRPVGCRGARRGGHWHRLVAYQDLRRSHGRDDRGRQHSRPRVHLLGRAPCCHRQGRPAPVAGGAVTSGAQVLVIEDDTAVMNLIGTVLRRHGFDVVLVGTGLAGLRHVHEHPPGVVVLDVGLPDLDGWQVLKQIRDVSEIPVLMLTGHAGETDKVRGPAGRGGRLSDQAIRDRRIHRPHRGVVTAGWPFAVRDQRRVRRRGLAGRLCQPHGRHGRGERGRHPHRVPAAGGPGPHAGQVLSTDQLLRLAWDDGSGHRLGPGEICHAPTAPEAGVGGPRPFAHRGGTGIRLPLSADGSGLIRPNSNQTATKSIADAEICAGC